MTNRSSTDCTSQRRRAERPAMFDLAQVTDLHLVERDHGSRTGTEWQRLQYLSAGRRIDCEARRKNALAALRLAGRNARHILLTGDLTEDGIPAQYELLAEVLDESGIDPRRATLVPGNHDRYADPMAFEDALAGPLQQYAAASTLGQIVELSRDAWLMPVSTAVAQSWFRSAGKLSDDDLEAIDRFAADAQRAGRLALVAQHHPPHGYGPAAWNFIDGLLNAAAGKALLKEHAGLSFVHGHTHKLDSVSFAGGRPAQAHSAAAIVSKPEHVRFYELTREALVAAQLAAAAPIGAFAGGCDAARLRATPSEQINNNRLNQRKDTRGYCIDS
jgi:Icc protein